jgi:hypothetical protein
MPPPIPYALVRQCKWVCEANSEKFETIEQLGELKSEA